MSPSLEAPASTIDSLNRFSSNSKMNLAHLKNRYQSYYVDAHNNSLELFMSNQVE